MSRKVVVLYQDTKHDVSDAARFGRIHYVFEAGERKPAVWTNAFIQTVLDRLGDMHFDPAIDYLVVTGSIVTIALVIARLAHDYESLNLLLYDQSEGEYVHKEIA